MDGINSMPMMDPTPRSVAINAKALPARSLYLNASAFPKHHLNGLTMFNIQPGPYVKAEVQVGANGIVVGSGQDDAEAQKESCGEA